jgi:hypothetical protein
MTRSLGFIVALGALALSGCTRPAPATAQSLHNRAGFELGCTDLVLVRIDDKSAGVWGCGRRVIYQETCADGHCHWVMEREVPPPAVYTAQTIPVAPNGPIVRKSDEWRARIPALAEDEPGF